MSKGPRDTQRSRVYEWERTLFRDHGIFEETHSLDECQVIASRIAGRNITVLSGRGRQRPCAYYPRRGHKPTIALVKWGRNDIIIAHEVAHILSFDITKPPHGSHFMKTYIDMLIAVGVDTTVRYLTVHAKAYGLKVKS